MMSLLQVDTLEQHPLSEMPSLYISLTNNKDYADEKNIFETEVTPRIERHSRTSTEVKPRKASW